MGFIYKLTSPSGKIYIGQTTRTLEKRLKEHCNGSEHSILSVAIKKYGIENFTKEIICECNDDDLNQTEIDYIKMYNCLEPNGYNIRTGGSNGKHSDLSKQRMRELKLGPLNHNYGKPRSDHFKQIMKEKKSGENHHFFGKQLSYEHKLNLSKSHKKDDLPMYLVKIKDRIQMHHYGGYAVVNHPNLPNKHFTSKKFSDEEKLKMAFDYLNSYKDKDEGSTTK